MEWKLVLNNNALLKCRKLVIRKYTLSTILKKLVIIQAAEDFSDIL